MLINRAIVNASPLIVLCKSQQAELLSQLFKEIWVPSAVWDEITVHQSDPAAIQLAQVNWATRIDSIKISQTIASWDLGSGESSVLSLALTCPPLSYTTILDDRAARRCAKSLGISTTGTGRLLILAKQRGLISQVTPRLQALRDSGLWLSDRLFNLIREQAGE